TVLGAWAASSASSSTCETWMTGSMPAPRSRAARAGEAEASTSWSGPGPAAVGEWFIAVPSAVQRGRERVQTDRAHIQGAAVEFRQVEVRSGALPGTVP